METANLDNVLENTDKVTPKSRAAIVLAATKDAASRVSEVRKRALARTEAFRNRINGPIPQNVGVALGGALAEVVRRKLVGRVTDNVLGQAVGLAALGVGAQFLEGSLGVPGLRSIGLGHMGAAGFVAASKGFDKEDARDPVYAAYQVTTEKFKKDKKKKEDKGDDDSDS